MTRRIHISAGGMSMAATLNDTQTTQKIWDALPIQAVGSRWGDEIYFRIPVKLGTEKGQPVVDAGDLGYWAPGQAFCIFFGPTPASQGNEVRPASPVTVFGHLEGDATEFKSVPDGAQVTIERIE